MAAPWICGVVLRSSSTVVVQNGECSMNNFKPNSEGMRKLEKDLAKRFSGGLSVPTGGTESAAVNSVKSQLRKMGVTPNDSEVRKIVRDARKG